MNNDEIRRFMLERASKTEAQQPVAPSTPGVYPLRPGQTPSELMAEIKAEEGRLARQMAAGQRPVEDEGGGFFGGLKTFGRSLPLLPGAIAARTGQAIQGQEGASVADQGWMDRFIAGQKENERAFVEDVRSKYGDRNFLPGIKVTDVAQVVPNLGFSAVSAGAGLGAGAATQLAAPLPGGGTALAYGTGMAASGATAYRMASNDIMQAFLEAKNEEKLSSTAGAPLTIEEENALKEDFSAKATSYGLWEAIPEAVGGGIAFKTLTTPLKKMLGKSLATRVLAKLAGTFGEELATETITQIGQEQATAGTPIGPEKAPSFTSLEDLTDALAQVAPQTVLVTALMGGGTMAGVKVWERTVDEPRKVRLLAGMTQEGRLSDVPDKALAAAYATAEDIAKKRGDKYPGLPGVLEELSAEIVTREKARMANEPKGVPAAEVAPEQPVRVQEAAKPETPAVALAEPEKVPVEPEQPAEPPKKEPVNAQALLGRYVTLAAFAEKNPENAKVKKSLEAIKKRLEEAGIALPVKAVAAPTVAPATETLPEEVKPPTAVIEGQDAAAVEPIRIPAPEVVVQPEPAQPVQPEPVAQAQQPVQTIVPTPAPAQEIPVTAPPSPGGMRIAPSRTVPSGETVQPAPLPDFDKMLTVAGQWKSAALAVDRRYAEDNAAKPLRLAHSKMTTKGDLDAFIMRRFGVAADEARAVSNRLTESFQPDPTMTLGRAVSEFADEPWAKAGGRYREDQGRAMYKKSAESAKTGAETPSVENIALENAQRAYELARINGEKNPDAAGEKAYKATTKEAATTAEGKDRFGLVEAGPADVENALRDFRKERRDKLAALKGKRDRISTQIRKGLQEEIAAEKTPEGTIKDSARALSALDLKRGMVNAVVIRGPGGIAIDETGELKSALVLSRGFSGYTLHQISGASRHTGQKITDAEIMDAFEGGSGKTPEAAFVKQTIFPGHVWDDSIAEKLFGKKTAKRWIKWRETLSAIQDAVPRYIETARRLRKEFQDAIVSGDMDRIARIAEGTEAEFFLKEAKKKAKVEKEQEQKAQAKEEKAQEPKEKAKTKERPAEPPAAEPPKPAAKEEPPSPAVKEVPSVVAKPTPVVKPTPEGVKVTVPMPAKEAKALTSKEQKSFLLAEIDRAAKAAPDVEPERPTIEDTRGKTEKEVNVIYDEAFARWFKEIGTVTIEVPGDGTFTVPNTKKSLLDFKKRAQSFPETTTKPLVPLKKKATPSYAPKKRPSGFAGWYYNPYSPRKEGLFIGDKATANIGDIWIHSNGYVIRAPKSGVVVPKDSNQVQGKEFDKKFQEDIIKPRLAGFEPAQIRGVAYIGNDANDKMVVAHVESKSGQHYAIQAQYADSILTMYPDAKVFISPATEETVQPMVFFKDKGEVVGAAMMLKPYDIGNTSEFPSEWVESYNRLYEGKQEVTTRNKAISETFAEKTKDSEENRKVQQAKAESDAIEEAKKEAEAEAEAESAEFSTRLARETSNRMADIPAADVRQFFPARSGWTMGTAGKGKIWLQHRSGPSLTVESVDSITPDEIAFTANRGRRAMAGEVVAGEFKGDTIRLVRGVADKWTAAHETYHFLERYGFVNKANQQALSTEIRKLRKDGKLPFQSAYDAAGKRAPLSLLAGVEDRARFMEEALRTREFDRLSSPVRAVMQKIADFIDGIVNMIHQTARGVVRDMESGKLAGRVPEVTAEATEGADYSNTSQRWYSALVRAIEAMDFKAMPAKDLAARIKKTPGIKQEELDWMGIEGWLNKQVGKVSKEDVLDWLDENAVDVQEVVKTGEPGAKLSDISIWNDTNESGTHILKMQWSDLEDIYAESHDNGETWDIYQDGEFLGSENKQDAQSVILNTIDRDYAHLLRGVGNTKFGQYQLPGGENYKELLLTLPEKPNYAPSFEEWWEDTHIAPVPTEGAILDISKDRYNSLIDKGLRKVNRKENFRSSHWDKPNVLAHVRFNERTGPNGERVLFIEEVQSDWHQKGRKEGYKGLSDEEMARKEELERHSIGEWSPEDMDWYNAIVNDREGRGVPDAPFKASSSWSLLAMKRMVRYAAENGFDMVAWTPGDVHTQRWGTERIEWKEDRASGKFVDAMVKEGKPSVSGGMYRNIRKLGSWTQEAFAKIDQQVELERIAKNWKIPADNLEFKDAPRKFWVEAKSQVGGEADGIDLEAEAESQGLNPENSAAVGSEAELTKAIKPILTEGQDAGALAKKLWARMQDEPSGVSMPRKEGFEGFYDKILPAAVNKFFNKKEWGGAKVGSMEIANTTAHALPITPEMRSKALREGMPLFQTKQKTRQLSDMADQYSQGLVTNFMNRYKTPDGKIDLSRVFEETGIELPTSDPDDLNKFTRRFQTMVDLAHDHWEMDNLLENQIARNGDANQMSIRDRETTKPYFELPAKSRKKVDFALLEGDRENKFFSNATLSGERFGLSDEERFAFWRIRKVLKQKLDHIMGNIITDIGEGALTEFEVVEVRRIVNRRNTALSSGTTEDAANAKMATSLNELGLTEKQIEAVQAVADWAFQRRAYVPHQWESEWLVKVVEGEGDAKKEYLFEVPTIRGTLHVTKKARRHAAERAAIQVIRDRLGWSTEKIAAMAKEKKIKPIRSRELPVELFEGARLDIINGILDSSVNALMAGFKDTVSPAEMEQLTDIRNALSKHVDELYKAKGFARHLIPRKGTLGYRTDLDNVLAEYLTGFNAYVAKGRAAHAFAQSMKLIDPAKKPNMWRSAREYVSDMLGPAEGEAGAFKRLAGAFFLAGDVSAAALNMTQNWTHGVAMLRSIPDAKGNAEKQLAKANKDVMAAWFADKKAGRPLFKTASKWITEDETNAIREAYERGYLDPGYFGEVTGIHANKVHESYTSDIGRLLYAGFTGAESLNRMSSFLAGYRRARDSKAEDPVKLVAKQVVLASHFLYGRTNRPEVVRKAGTFGNVLYTFMTYPVNNLVFLKHRVQEAISAWPTEDRAMTMKVLGSHLAWTMALGGLTALPFAWLAGFIYRLFTDPSDDWEKWLYENTGKNFARATSRGIPAVFGSDLSWRIQGTDIIDLPVGFQTGKTIYKRVQGGYKLIKRGDVAAGIFMAMPDMIRNPYIAFGLEGGTGIEGTPPIEYTPGEKVYKALGFTPTREAETRSAQELATREQKRRAEKIADFAELFIHAKTQEDRQAVLADLATYNAEQKKDGGVMITGKALRSAILRRQKNRAKAYAERKPKYMRQFQQDIGEAYGFNEYGQ